MDDADDGAVEPLALEPFAPRPLTAADFPPANPLLANFTYRTSAMFGRDWRAGRAEYRQLVEREALAFGLPPALVDAVMAVESRYNPAVVGMDGEVGLMQVMLPTARMMGFAGTPAELASPEVNVHYGVRYLAGAWRRANGDLCTATMKYRAGHGETRFSYLSVEYCTRVRAHLAGQRRRRHRLRSTTDVRTDFGKQRARTWSRPDGREHDQFRCSEHAPAQRSRPQDAV